MVKLAGIIVRYVSKTYPEFAIPLETEPTQADQYWPSNLGEIVAREGFEPPTYGL